MKPILRLTLLLAAGLLAAILATCDSRPARTAAGVPVAAAAPPQTAAAEIAAPAPAGRFVATRNNDRRSVRRVFHYPWCASAQNIKPGNKIGFATAVEAIMAGYSACAACKPCDK